MSGDRSLVRSERSVSHHEAVSVAVRVRPMSRKELASGARCIVSTNGSSISVVDPTALIASESMKRGDAPFDSSTWARHFTFDHCFNSIDAASKDYANQNTVFRALGTRVLESAWNGYNVSLLAYGQTGAGKSYSMMGTGAVLDEEVEPKDYGLIPRISFALFQSIEQQTTSLFNKPQFRIEVSYLEVYNEVVYDLFSINSKTKKKKEAIRRVREHPTSGIFVEDLTVVSVESYGEVGQLMSLGGRARTVAATNMNQSSSRSHAIFNFTFSQIQNNDSGEEKRSKIAMVDLAGSERVDQTGASGERLREAKNINKSLATLCDVVNALASNKHGKDAHIPYRNSVLTWLLKESLGGNAITTMLAVVSPCASHFEESLSTLKYAERAKKMKTKVKVNSRVSDENIITALRNEVAALKRELTLRQSGMDKTPKRKDRLTNDTDDNDEEFDESYDETDEGHGDRGAHGRAPSLVGGSARGGARDKHRQNTRRKRTNSPRHGGAGFILSPIEEGLEELSPSPTPELMSSRTVSPSSSSSLRDEFNREGMTEQTLQPGALTTPALQYQLTQLENSLHSREVEVEDRQKSMVQMNDLFPHSQQANQALQEGKLPSVSSPPPEPRFRPIFSTTEMPSHPVGSSSSSSPNRLGKVIIPSLDLSNSALQKQNQLQIPNERSRYDDHDHGRNDHPSSSIYTSSDSSGVVINKNSIVPTIGGRATMNKQVPTPKGAVIGENTRALAILGQDSGSTSIALQSSAHTSHENSGRPRLVNLNQDPLFSECLVFYINEGVTLIGSDPNGDIVLTGSDIMPRHAVLTCSSGGGGGGGGGGYNNSGKLSFDHSSSSHVNKIEVAGSNAVIHLCPVDGAATYVNGRMISSMNSVHKNISNNQDKELDDEENDHRQSRQLTEYRRSESQSQTRPILLAHNARVIFGKSHVFRFEQPMAKHRILDEDIAQRHADNALGIEMTNGMTSENSENSQNNNGESLNMNQQPHSRIDWDIALRELFSNSPDTGLLNHFDALNSSRTRTLSRSRSRGGSPHRSESYSENHSENNDYLNTSNSSLGDFSNHSSNVDIWDETSTKNALKQLAELQNKVRRLEEDREKSILNNIRFMSSSPAFSTSSSTSSLPQQSIQQQPINSISFQNVQSPNLKELNNQLQDEEEEEGTFFNNPKSKNPHHNDELVRGGEEDINNSLNLSLYASPHNGEDESPSQKDNLDEKTLSQDFTHKIENAFQLKTENELTQPQSFQPAQLSPPSSPSSSTSQIKTLEKVMTSPGSVGSNDEIPPISLSSVYGSWQHEKFSPTKLRIVERHHFSEQDGNTLVDKGTEVAVEVQENKIDQVEMEGGDDSSDDVLALQQRISRLMSSARKNSSVTSPLSTDDVHKGGISRHPLVDGRDLSHKFHNSTANSSINSENSDDRWDVSEDPGILS